MKEPAKEITAEEFLKSKQIPIPTYEAVRLMDSGMKDYRIVDLLKEYASLKEREVIKEAIEKIQKIKIYNTAFEVDLRGQTLNILESMLNPATNGEDKGE
jgi:hypothetical protein